MVDKYTLNELYKNGYIDDNQTQILKDFYHIKHKALKYMNVYEDYAKMFFGNSDSKFFKQPTSHEYYYKIWRHFNSYINQNHKYKTVHKEVEKESVTATTLKMGHLKTYLLFLEEFIEENFSRTS